MENLPTADFHSDHDGETWIGSTEAFLDEVMEARLGNLGFCTIVEPWNGGIPVISSARAVHKPEPQTDPDKMRKAELSVRLSGLLCGARFVHTIRQISMFWSSIVPEGMTAETFLRDWLQGFVSHPGLEKANRPEMAKRPLESASIMIEQTEPGVFKAMLSIEPAFELPAPVELTFAFPVPPCQ